MTLYAIKINGGYFKEYVYADRNKKGRHGGHTSFGALIRDGDIIDIVTTKEPERTETRRSVGNTLATILQIDKYRGTKIEIVPVEGDES
jgi:hypothetical protein